MKFIHTADWHLGKLVHGVYMTEEQREVLQQFVRLVEEETPDAVVIAGDLYDRSVPPTGAVELLNEMLFAINVELKTPIVAISGNHDSAERLSFGSSWFRHSQFYLKGKVDDQFSPVRINGVNFYCIPYAEPGTIRQLFGDNSIHTHQGAMKRLIGKLEEEMDCREPNIFVGHAFVLGGKTTDSERTLSVGGSGCVDAGLFAPFNYAALGHLHSPDAIKHEKVRYSGSLLKYSFSEANQRKSVSIVTVDEKGTVSIEERTLRPKRDMRVLEGTLEELLDPARIQAEATEDYLKITLLDRGAIIDPMGKLRQAYPNVLHLERKIDMIDQRQKESYGMKREEKKDDIDLFADFYSEMTTDDFTPEKRKLMERVIQEAQLEANQK
ncbi:exonuclease SbcCD subunit D [Pseudobacillus badius]|uniref:exonuclease SbcCD subunit D n=1 Tax=Bacillus badius TaxID=1455 RepID=UPI0007B043CE|nr:exonuclease SbcCD subunit D [Bacillus badius]KZO01868.1 exonuclease sbcCD subunit D [Bacillus badius]OCS90261.1 exonuclease sbcCD subunit D [Bacillus badius]OVE53813.1 exonuclease sbcCD subunit D [Bacillus badius]TDW06076.1 exodeoxyribonuclease I subunit D [Bacillus badius]